MLKFRPCSSEGKAAFFNRMKTGEEFEFEFE
jgi:hypothetical protein